MLVGGRPTMRATAESTTRCMMLEQTRKPILVKRASIEVSAGPASYAVSGLGCFEGLSGRAGRVSTR